MRINYRNSGISYSIEVIREGRREVEARTLDIQPDKSLWTSANKLKRAIDGNNPQSALHEPTVPKRRRRGPSILISEKSIPFEGVTYATHGR